MCIYSFQYGRDILSSRSACGASTALLGIQEDMVTGNSQPRGYLMLDDEILAARADSFYFSSLERFEAIADDCVFFRCPSACKNQNSPIVWFVFDRWLVSWCVAA